MHVKRPGNGNGKLGVSFGQEMRCMTLVRTREGTSSGRIRKGTLLDVRQLHTLPSA